MDPLITRMWQRHQLGAPRPSLLTRFIDWWHEFWARPNRITYPFPEG